MPKLIIHLNQLVILISEMVQHFLRVLRTKLGRLFCCRSEVVIRII
jgi:hypothetical protein